ncbi:MAG: septum formation initiator family protein [Candidatus Tenebribacter davisii]|nr:septum formation initiator family protein [Candidatus Tenebribacter davisii]
MNKINFSKKSIVYILILFLILYILFFDSASFYNTYRLKHNMTTLEQNISELQKENEQLKIENEKLETDKDIWEKKARELGMQKEGEEIFRFKESDDL